MLTQEQKANKFDEQYEKRQAYNKKRNAKNNILVRMAIEAGFDKKITDEMIDEELNK